jgi:phosphoserine aminotransferase
MTTFYPGPSKVYPEVADYAAEAVRSGITSLNHRSVGFMDIVRETVRLLHEKLDIPADYHVALVSSATECWEIVVQSLTAEASLHPYSGAFGEKWLDYTHRINSQAVGFNAFDKEASEHGNALYNAFLENADDSGTLCLVQNETSNGTQLTMNALLRTRREFGGIIAVDAVSSMAGIALDWPMADVWFASVQKCFGLPAGLAVLVYSPRALERATAIGERAHYNSLLFIHENFRQFQTPYTPNGLGIYCLMRILQQIPPIAQTDARTRQRAAYWYAFFETEMTNRFRLLIEDADFRSRTVIAVKGRFKSRYHIGQWLRAMEKHYV